MILPTKRLSEDRALLTVGAEILRILNEPKTVSRTWAELNRYRCSMSNPSPVTFDWFILALDLLFILNAISFDTEHLKKVEP